MWCDGGTCCEGYAIFHKKCTDTKLAYHVNYNNGEFVNSQEELSLPKRISVLLAFLTYRI